MAILCELLSLSISSITTQRNNHDASQAKFPSNNAGDHSNFGHDTVEARLDKALASASPINLIFFFGGIEDARHLFGIIMRIADHESSAVPQSNRKYHFTINDVKASTLARDLIAFTLLQLVASSENPSKEYQTLTTVFYLFCFQVMPAFVYKHLQKTISTVIATICSGDSGLDWVFLGTPARDEIVKALQSWQVDAGRLYTTSYMSSSVARNLEQTRHKHIMKLRAEYTTAPKGCEKEMPLYYKIGAFYLPTSSLERHEPALQTLISQYERPDKMPPKKIKKHVEEKWKVNVTLVDVVWEKETPSDGVLDLQFNPYDAVESLYAERPYYHHPLHQPEHATMLYDYVAPYFVRTADAINHLKGRMKVEVVCGELNTVLEKIRYDVLDS